MDKDFSYREYKKGIRAGSMVLLGGALGLLVVAAITEPSVPLLGWGLALLTCAGLAELYLWRVVNPELLVEAAWSRRRIRELRERSKAADIRGFGLFVEIAKALELHALNGNSPMENDQHTAGELAIAAVCFAGHYCGIVESPSGVPTFWPFVASAWTPTGGRPDLLIAAVLILSEIERLDRATGSAADEATYRVDAHAT